MELFQILRCSLHAFIQLLWIGTVADARRPFASRRASDNARDGFRPFAGTQALL